MLKPLYQLIYRHVRALRRSLDALKQTPWMTGMTGVAIALTLLLPLLFGFLVHAFKPLMSDWQKSKEISLYLTPAFNSEAAPDLISRIEVVPGVSKVYFVSSDDSLKSLEKEEGMEDIRTYLPENPLPSMIEVIPKASIDTAEKMDALSQTLRQLPEVDEVRLNLEWVGRLHGLLTFLNDLTWVLGGLFGLMVIFIIRNLLSLSAQTHHEEIQVFKLVGATDAFILRPFLYTGAALGFLGALGAFLGGYLIVFRLGHALQTLEVPGLAFSQGDLFSLKNLGVSLGFGVVLGWLGAYLSLKHQLAHIEPCH